jgi:prepilin-type N-terminal cleavage/methylation domain-containing protein
MGSPGCRKRSRQRGFTLLELLITLAITTVGMIGVMSLHLSVGRGNDGAARGSEAMAVATDTVEWLRSMTFAQLQVAVTNPTVGPPVTVNLPTVPGRAGMVFRRSIVVTVLNASLLTRFRVQVDWTEDGATPGGNLDHRVAFEFVRTMEEVL